MSFGGLIRNLALPLAAGAFCALVLIERRRPLRRQRESGAIRTGRNLTIAGIAAIATHLIERPIAERASALVKRRNLGLLKLLPLPMGVERLAAVILLDYTLYLWHVLTHRMPFLWRFHVVHHTDLDLDTTTALRFHFGELIFSVAWRATQIVVIGVSPDSLRIWRAVFIPSILFHHSNMRLPEKLENLLGNFIVTPRMHGIHHSVVEDETNSNWSSGLSIWDKIHGTFRNNSEHDSVVIGVQNYQHPVDVTLGKLLTLPFRKQPFFDHYLPSTDHEQ